VAAALARILILQQLADYLIQVQVAVAVALYHRAAMAEPEHRALLLYLI
jgi:hypothetical protein